MTVYLLLTVMWLAMSSVCYFLINTISFLIPHTSSVDHVIGPHGLLASKARILVTNSITFIKQFNQLAFIRRGIILESGSYETLMTNPEGELSKLV